MAWDAATDSLRTQLAEAQEEKDKWETACYDKAGECVDQLAETINLKAELEQAVKEKDYLFTETIILNKETEMVEDLLREKLKTGNPQNKCPRQLALDIVEVISCE